MAKVFVGNRRITASDMLQLVCGDVVVVVDTVAREKASARVSVDLRRPPHSCLDGVRFLARVWRLSPLRSRAQCQLCSVLLSHVVLRDSLCGCACAAAASSW
jgi:hypothetical protein